MSAARAVLQGAPRPAGPELAESARLMGLQLPPEAADPPQEPLCDVWAELWPAVRLFVAMKTQVRTGGMGGVLGLDYSVLPLVQRRLALPRRQGRQLFADLQVMERALIDWHNEG